MIKTKLGRLALPLACALALGGPARAGDKPVPPADVQPCAKESFRGKGAKARRQACLDGLMEQRAQEERGREEVEAWRRELRERCAQDPRRCETHRAELDERMQAHWRDQQGEGHAAD